MQRRPLADDLRIGARVDELIGRGAGEGIGRGVADAVARGLDGVHLDPGKVLQKIRDLDQLRQLYWMFWRVVKWP